jgi:hypothetical protein
MFAPAPVQKFAMSTPGRVITLLGFAFCICFSLAACRRAQTHEPDVVLTHEIAPQPARVGPVTFSLVLADSSGNFIKSARVVLEGTMSHPGMAPVFSEAQEVEAGCYRAALEFTMAGDWIIIVHLTLADGRTLSRQIYVNGVLSA